MTLSPEEISMQLPFYLTADQKVGLTKALKSFQKNSTGKFSTISFEKDAIQGDCCANVPFYDHSKGDMRYVNALILSNSCDISDENVRDFPPRITLAPMMKLESIERALESKGYSSQIIASKLQSIRDQTTTNVYYIFNDLDGKEYVVFFDQAQSMPLSFFKKSTSGVSFSLTMFGFYLMLFKVSVHFCRFQEKISRP